MQPTDAKGRAAARAAMALVDGERADDVLLPVVQRVGTTSGPSPGR